MKHLGDITKIDGTKIEKVSCVSFGSPCQDLSIAGKRNGLAGERSGLFMEAIRIIKEMREDELVELRRCGRADKSVRPMYAIWENVVGAFSSNNGDDFRVVLEELIRVKEPKFDVPRCKKWSKSGAITGNDWSIAWRTFDAQYIGVPQRRKRICVLCDFDGQSAADILLTDTIRMVGNSEGISSVLGTRERCTGKVQFERKSLSGDFESCIETWKGTAKNPERCPIEYDQSYTLKIRGGCDTYQKNDGSIGTAGKGALIQTELSATLGVSQDQTLFK